MDDDSSRDIRLIQSYDEDKIGSKMTTNFISITKGLIVKQAMKELWGQASYKTSIMMYDIPKEKVWYLVEECYTNPYKYCDIVERIYAEPFEDLEAAKKYFKELKTHNLEGYGNGTKKFLLPIRTNWLKVNGMC